MQVTNNPAAPGTVGSKGWSFRGIATRPTMRVQPGPDVPAGARVWVTAVWFNARGRRDAPVV